jgi:regulator of CtrA degradation
MAVNPDTSSMAPLPHVGAATAHVFTRTFNETLALLVASRDYMAYAAPAGADRLADAQRLSINCEAMRLTARLSHVMAWLLAQKAVQAGEITRRSAAADYYIPHQDVLLLESETEAPGLPPRLRELLAASRALYVRVSRLDALFQRAALN